ncbi:MAG TPA: DUF350 domain-containing protein, partial [Longimicrobiaceae bacterium]|nr:DUF350 domain-containing protein [Longimicrobiaceae bacterium]
MRGLLAGAVYAVLGIVIFVAALVAVDRMTPGTLWKEIIEEHNTALAIMMAGVSIALAIMIAASIH